MTLAELLSARIPDLRSRAMRSTELQADPVLPAAIRERHQHHAAFLGWLADELEVLASCARAGEGMPAGSVHVHDSAVSCRCGWKLGGTGGPERPPLFTQSRPADAPAVLRLEPHLGEATAVALPPGHGVLVTLPPGTDEKTQAQAIAHLSQLLPGRDIAVICGEPAGSRARPPLIWHCFTSYREAMYHETVQADTATEAAEEAARKTSTAGKWVVVHGRAAEITVHSETVYQAEAAP